MNDRFTTKEGDMEIEQPKAALMDLVTAAVEAAQAQLAKFDEIDPTFFIMTEHRLRVVIAPFSNEFEKFHAYATVRKLIAETGAWAYVMVSEAWASSDPDVKPEFAEDRRDVLMVAARTMSGDSYHASADIAPATKKAARKIGELSEMKDVSGDVTNFFSPHVRLT